MERRLGNRRTALLLLAIPLLAGRAPARAENAAAPRVREVRIQGCSVLPQRDLQALLKTRPGEAFDASLLEQDIQAIEAFYRKEGYPLAHVTSGFGIDTDGVVTIPVDEGRIERIEIKHKGKTRDYVIRRQLETRPGEVYSTQKLNTDRRRLYNLGFFNSVSIAPSAGSEPGKAVLTVSVDERLTGSVGAAFGYTNTAGLVGYAQWSDTNFLGTGQTLAFSWQRGVYASGGLFGSGGSDYTAGARTGYDIGYYSPWVLRRGFSAGARVYNAATTDFSYFAQDIDPANVKGYEWRRGTVITAAKELGRGFSVGILGRNEDVNYDIAPLGAVAPAGESALPAKVTSVRLSAIRGPINPFADRDGIPRTGFFVELGQANSLGERSTYQKLGATATNYVELNEKDTLASRLQVGWSTGGVPFAELYAVGGPQTVRGYQRSEFLGTRLLVLNTELRHKLKEGLSAAAFVDLGYAWPRYRSLNLGDLRPAAGLGIRVQTPFGPFRLDYAFGREGGRAHLTAGDPF